MIELLNIDCMTFMATLPDKAFDLAIHIIADSLSLIWLMSENSLCQNRNTLNPILAIYASWDIS
jgi:hypothetical protein